MPPQVYLDNIKIIVTTRCIILWHYNILILFLRRACRFGKKKIVQILLERGASANEKNVAGSTPLHLACEYGDGDIVKVST